MSSHPESHSLVTKLCRRAIVGLYGVWFCAVFCITALVMLCGIAVLPGENRRRRLARASARLLFRLTSSWPDIRGIDLLPVSPAVVVANHASYLDGVLLAAVLPHRFRFVIKREVSQVPLVNFVLKRVGAHFVERFDPQRGAADARRIMQTAARGESMVFFPEGTFTEEPGLRMFHKGAFRVAANKLMPIAPVTIIGTRRMLPANAWLPRPASLAVIVGEPFATSPEISLAQIIARSRAQILATLDEPDLHAAEQKLMTAG